MATGPPTEPFDGRESEPSAHYYETQRLGVAIYFFNRVIVVGGIEKSPEAIGLTITPIWPAGVVISALA